MSQLFTSGGQNIGASASASVRKCSWLVYSHELGSEILRIYADYAGSPLFVLDSVGTTVTCTCLWQHSDSDSENCK